MSKYSKKYVHALCRRATIDINQALNYLERGDLENFTINIVAVLDTLSELTDKQIIDLEQ